jgi:nitrite reductase/ring-hydroxylating ferredoxin subunit
LSTDLTSVAVYERTLQASAERVWENVHDWEHLPWLHAGSFRSIDLVERGDWGWRADIGLRAADATIRLELVVEDERRYVSRTLSGPGARGEIWTTVDPIDAEQTAVRVEFFVPDVDPKAADAIGAGFVSLYTRLWDEDEAMMRHREAMLGRELGRGGGEIDLGDEDGVRARAPFVVDLASRPVRIVAVDGRLLAHSPVCPHRLGPLDAAEIEGGVVTCPWHGYRFDVASGRRCDADGPMRLAPAPRVVVEQGRVLLRP